MKKRWKYFPLLRMIMLCLLPGCQNSGQSLAPNDAKVSISPTETDNPSATSTIPPETSSPTTEQPVKADLVEVEALLNSTNIQKIYYGPAGTLLAHSLDTLYWFDMNSACALAQRPAEDWLVVEYFLTEMHNRHCLHFLR